MSDCIKPKTFRFEQEIDVSIHSQKIPIVAPVQPIKTNIQNAQEVKTDFVSDEDVAAELAADYKPPCFQLIHVANIQNTKEQILKR